MKYKSHKQLNKILIIILIFATFIMNINIANAKTVNEWLNTIKHGESKTDSLGNSMGGQIFGHTITSKSYMKHPNFFGDGCECGLGTINKSDKFTKNKGKLDLKLTLGEPLNKKVTAGGFIENGIYYPTCEEFNYFFYLWELDGKQLKLVEEMRGNFEPYKPTKEEQQGNQKKEDSIDISSMYKENEAKGDPLPITLGNDAGDNEEYLGTGVSKHIDFSNEGSNSSINNLFKWIKSVCNIILGFSIVIGLGSIVYLFISLGINSSNPEERSKIKTNLLVVCTATALSTSLSAVFNFIVTKIAGI